MVSWFPVAIPLSNGPAWRPGKMMNCSPGGCDRGGSGEDFCNRFHIHNYYLQDLGLDSIWGASL